LLRFPTVRVPYMGFDLGHIPRMLHVLDHPCSSG
jgi:hypothetical protein